MMIRDAKLGCQPRKPAMGEGDWTNSIYYNHNQYPSSSAMNHVFSICSGTHLKS